MAYVSAVAPFGFPEYADPDRILAWFARLGYSRCQYYRPRGHGDDVDAVHRVVRAHGFTIEAMHGHFGADLDISAPDEARRREAVAAFQSEAEVARSMGAGIVIVHPSSCAQTPQGTAPVDWDGCPTDQPLRRAALERSCAELAAIGERDGVIFAIENLPPWFPAGGNAVALAHLVRSLESEHLRLCFDTGHAHIEACHPGAQTATSVVNMLSACIDLDVVAYLHVHDNDGRADVHVAPAEGTIDWCALGACLADAPPDLPCMMELFMSPADLDRFERLDANSLKHQWEHVCGCAG
ncbi:MAG: sugar phosphate isomerase/epimerase [Planctomycetes bacterium]|nr:sugar phosphate isomerase/epimerase [Planctomycetota bacterium]NOG54345.1 sugar phosphate isomerase/epimerase [Planctomycetota bacterium]